MSAALDRICAEGVVTPHDPKTRALVPETAAHAFGYQVMQLLARETVGLFEYLPLIGSDFNLWKCVQISAP